MDDDKLLLKIKDVAKRLSLGRSLVYRLVSCGDLRSVTVGRSRRVLASDLEEFVKRLGEDDAPVGPAPR